MSQETIEIKLTGNPEVLKKFSETLENIWNDYNYSDHNKTKIYTIDEVAKIVKKHPWTIRRHINADPPLLNATKQGKSWYINKNNLHKYLSKI